MVVDQLPRLGKRERICLLLFTCNYVVSVWRGFLFLWVLGMGYVILLWHSLSLPYNFFENGGRRTDAGSIGILYYIPCEPNGSGEVIINYLTQRVIHICSVFC